MTITNDFLLQLFKQHGIEEGLTKINVEDVEDHTAKIVLRTISHSHQTLMKTLKSGIKKI